MSDVPAAVMSTKYGVDFFDGEERPRLIINGAFVISGTHQGGVHVESGQLQLNGNLQGSLDIQSGAGAIIRGCQEGSVSVGSGANVLVFGSIEGSVRVARGGVVIIESGGKLAGGLANYGDVIVRGVFGGPLTGDRQLRLEDRGYVKQPVLRHGVSYYEW